MEYLRRTASGIVLAGLILNPQALTHYQGTTVTPVESTPLVAAVGAANIGLDKTTDSVLRIGMEVGGTLTFPQANWDESSGAFVPTKKNVTADVTAYWVGTGFVIDPAGYLVTNAHVVDTSSDALSAALWNEYQSEVVTDFAKEYPDLSQSQLDSLTSSFINYVGKYGQWGTLTYNPVVFNPDKPDAIGDFRKLFDSGYKIEIKKAGNPYPQIGKDVAIVKIETDKKFTPLTLGDSSGLVTGSTVYVVGYPTVADISDKSFLVPTVTSGIVSALKPSDLGDYKVIQVDANIAGGNSGGPVLNDRGQVIGIATFGATESDGYNWALPIELAKEYMNELNIKPQNGGVVAGMFAKIPSMLWPLAVGVLVLLVLALAVALLIHRRRLSRLRADAVKPPAIVPVSPPKTLTQGPVSHSTGPGATTPLHI